jgi:hypothetical protein
LITTMNSMKLLEAPKSLAIYGSPTNGHIPTRTGDPHDVNVVLYILEMLTGYRFQRLRKTLAGKSRENS